MEDKNDRLEFKMYGYKGRFNRTNKDYKKLKEEYKKLEKYYKNALNNCFELDNEKTELEIENDLLKNMIITERKKLQRIKEYIEKGTQGEDK